MMREGTLTGLKSRRVSRDREGMICDAVATVMYHRYSWQLGYSLLILIEE